MAYEPKDGDIIIFKNKNKKETQHPDYTGSAIINGEKMRIAMWIKGEKPKTFISGKIELDKWLNRNVTPEPEIKQNDLPF